MSPDTAEVDRQVLEGSGGWQTQEALRNKKMWAQLRIEKQVQLPLLLEGGDERARALTAHQVLP